MQVADYFLKVEKRSSLDKSKPQASGYNKVDEYTDDSSFSTEMSTKQATSTRRKKNNKNVISSSSESTTSDSSTPGRNLRNTETCQKLQRKNPAAYSNRAFSLVPPDVAVKEVIVTREMSSKKSHRNSKHKLRVMETRKLQNHNKRQQSDETEIVMNPTEKYITLESRCEGPKKCAKPFCFQCSSVSCSN